ncbi:acyl-CoA thioesterase domain-containing protein [Citricoccus zhacaiensis]|uniref:acyl-CoA thioesterase domain-containing protein n=1 Tax=Citricoccus zhacaiensis TaxID=489142 RepID=UPI00357139B0
MSYLRPVPLGATVRVATEVLHCGRSFGLVHVTVSLPNGKPVLVGRVTGGAA